MLALTPGTEPTLDYTTASFDHDDHAPAWRPRWLRRLAQSRLGRRLAALHHFDTPSHTWPALLRLPQRTTALALPGAPLPGWGAGAPIYLEWVEGCHQGCEGVAIGGAPLRSELLRYTSSGDGLPAKALAAWSERAWQVALALEAAAHMRPLFLPDRGQVGFCCGSAALAVEVVTLILADNVEARLARTHEDRPELDEPCDVLLPLRPTATPDELRDVVAAAVRATHTVLGAR